MLKRVICHFQKTLSAGRSRRRQRYFKARAFAPIGCRIPAVLCMTGQHLRWGILGAARVAHSWAAAAKECSNAQVIAVASRSYDRAKDFAARHGIEKAYGSYAELLDDTTINAIYIPLPNSLHAEWTRNCVRCNKHVLCEKPLAATADEVDEIRRLAKTSGVCVAEGFPHLFHPQFLPLRQLIYSQRLGQVRCIQSVYAGPLLRRGGIIGDHTLGGGALYALGCYQISLSVALLGLAPTKVMGAQCLTASGVDESFTAILAFPNSITQLAWTGISGPLRFSFTIIAERGSIDLTAPFRPDLDGNTNGYNVTDETGSSPIRFNPCNPFVAEIIAFGERVLRGIPDTPWSLESSSKAAACLAALRESAYSGRPVEVRNV